MYTAPTTPDSAPVDPEPVVDETTPHHQPTVAATLVLPSGEERALSVTTAITIGRHSDCDIVLADSQVSRRHGRLVSTSDGWHYADLGSRNGTNVNERPCTDAVLATGDVLVIGRSELIFHASKQLEMECA